MKKYIFLFILLFVSKNVYAECSYEQQAKLNSEASTIKAIYEEEIGYLDSSDYVCADGQEECDNECNMCNNAVHFCDIYDICEIC